MLQFIVILICLIALALIERAYRPASGGKLIWDSRRKYDDLTGETYTEYRYAILKPNTHALDHNAMHRISHWSEWKEFPRPVNSEPSREELNWE